MQWSKVADKEVKQKGTVIVKTIRKINKKLHIFQQKKNKGDLRAKSLKVSNLQKKQIYLKGQKLN